MNQKVFNKMWHKAYWHWAGLYTLVGAIIGVIGYVSLLLYGKYSDKKSSSDDLFE